MTRHIFAACGAVAIAGLTLSAQTPQSSPTQPPGARTPADNARTATMTGCLKPWDGSMGAIGSTDQGAGSTTAGAGTQFVLTNISENPKATEMPRPSGTTPGSGATTAPTPTPHPSMAHGTVVVKAGSGDVNLKQHLNHKVELTGMLATDSSAMPRTGDRPGTTPGSTTKPGTPQTPGTPGSTGSPSTMGKPSTDQMKMPTFTVTALKMVSATCD